MRLWLFYVVLAGEFTFLLFLSWSHCSSKGCSAIAKVGCFCLVPSASLPLSKKYSLSHGTCFAQRLPKCVESHLGTDHRTTRPCGCCKASVQRFTPLSLQLFSKQADVGSSLITLLALLLYMWYIFSAIIETVGAPSTGRADGRMGSCVFVLSSLPGWLVSRLTRCCTCKVRLKAGC